MVYDELGRKTKDIDALGGTTTYLYDAVDNQTGIIDPDGNRTTFTLDALNRVTQETDPLTHSITMAYDSADRLTSLTDRLGQRIDNSYDLDGRLVTETWRNAGGTVVNTLTFVYDGVGNQTVAQDSHGAYTMTFDALNRESTVKGLYSVTLTFSYDAVGNRTKTQDSFGGVLTSVFDNANRLISQQFGGSGQTPARFDLTYTERNQLATLTRYSDLAGTTKIGESDYSYDAAGRLQNLQHKNGSSTVLANYTYTYDLASRVTSETLNGAAPTTYVYDNTNQLTNDGTKAYSYDANGNRTMTGYTTGADNQLTNDGVYTYSYDAEGNLTKKSKGASAETWTFTYDNRNQMTGVTERSTDGGGTLLFQGTYVYDVYNNRVEADEYVNGSGTTVTKSVYFDQGTLFADLTSGNAMQTRYLHQDNTQYAPLVARIDGNGVEGLLLDRLGSTRNIINGSGTLIGTVVYDGFGNITSESSPTNTGNVTFTGLTFLRNAALLDADFRVYNPLTGRWDQEDPIRWQAGDANLSRDVGNNPTNLTDPTGLQQQKPPPQAQAPMVDPKQQAIVQKAAADRKARLEKQEATARAEANQQALNRAGLDASIWEKGQAQRQISFQINQIKAALALAQAEYYARMQLTPVDRAYADKVLKPYIQDLNDSLDKANAAYYRLEASIRSELAKQWSAFEQELAAYAREHEATVKLRGPAPPP
jgi:RHS repeat-associated protein